MNTYRNDEIILSQESASRFIDSLKSGVGSSLRDAFVEGIEYTVSNDGRHVVVDIPEIPDVLICNDISYTDKYNSIVEKRLFFTKTIQIKNEKTVIKRNIYCGTKTEQHASSGKINSVYNPDPNRKKSYSEHKNVA